MQIVKTLERMFTEGLINRREFMARLSALGLAVTVSPLLMSKKAEAAVPKNGGHFVMGGYRRVNHGFHGSGDADVQHEPESQLADQKQPCGSRSQF
jgi:hypothetical protein